MARTTKAKKQAEAPQVNIGAEIFASLRELEKIKGIPVDYMVERLKQALTNAYRKDREDHRDIPGENVVVSISEEGLTMHQIKTVVEELEDIALEIHVDAAKRFNPDLKIGDTLTSRPYSICSAPYEARTGEAPFFAVTVRNGRPDSEIGRAHV